jgi:hypothetical protein
MNGLMLTGQIITSILLAIAAIGVGGVLLYGLSVLLQFLSKRDVAWLVGGAVFVVCIASIIYKALFV